jgi:hypothetical protein
MLPPASPELSSAAPSEPEAAPSGPSPGALPSALRVWLSAYRTEVLLFLAAFFFLASFSSFRFLRQSAAPHFVYQSKAWLEGRLDLDPAVLPNLEDWACVRLVEGVKVRCEGPLRTSDRWYVSFPPFPSVLMLPFVAVNGYQLNDTSFGVIVGALALALFYALLRFLTKEGESDRDSTDNLILAVTLGFGTLFFYCAIRGEVWFSAEVLGVALTCLYVRNAISARHPALAGLFFSMAVLTRTPLVFSGVFFVLEAICPGPDRAAQWKAFQESPRPALRRLGIFAAAAAPLALLAAAYNVYRFGSVAEFGHRFFYDNRVNIDIDRFGLFHFEYLQRNLQAAFLLMPRLSLSPFRLDYSPHGLSLFLTLPVLLLVLWPQKSSRLMLPLWVTVAACALPGFFYQNTGYLQFGFRFSLDYTPFVMLLLALSGWRLRSLPTAAVLAVGYVVNFWGAVAFRGYTELMRRW